jgi:hypothetical protein
MFLVQCLFCACLVVSATASVGIAISPNDAVAAAKSVGGLSTPELLALVCLGSLSLSFYLVRTLIVMAKKPCIYLETNK